MKGTYNNVTEELSVLSCIALQPCTHGGGGGVSSVRVRDPLPALQAHLVTKGQWLQAIHRVAPKAPENFVPFAGTPENAGLGSISAHSRAPKKAGVR